MSKFAKTLEKMRNNPRDWRIDDLLTVASHYQIEVRNEKSRQKNPPRKTSPSF